jgi:4-hydroxy-4-methyl-2-oxoglutarate aldolase
MVSIASPQYERTLNHHYDSFQNELRKVLQKLFLRAIVIVMENVSGELISLGAATLAESGGIPLSPRIRPIWPGAAFAAPVLTAQCAAGDNLAIHAAVARAGAGPGRVLAVAFDGAVARGYWGEVLTTAAQTAGLVALVIDGEVRDTAAIERHGFPVFAAGVALRGSSKTGPGSVGTEITVGDVRVYPGDWLVGDADGVVCIRAADLAAVRAAAAARAAKETRLFEQLLAGQTTVGLLCLDLAAITPGI